ncbi:hypothetical protein PSTT_07253, partial [Puccinia striiformis]
DLTLLRLFATTTSTWAMSWYKYNALVRIPIFLALLNDSIWTIALDAELPAGLGRRASKGSSLLLDDEVSEMPKEVFSTSTSRRRTGEFKASDLKQKLDSSDSDPSSNEAGHLTARLEVATTPKVVDGSETAKDVDDIAGEGSGLSSDNASHVDEHHGSKGVSPDIENEPGKTTNQSMGTVRRNPEDSESTDLNQRRTENVKSSDVDQIENKDGDLNVHPGIPPTPKVIHEAKTGKDLELSEKEGGGLTLNEASKVDAFLGKAHIHLLGPSSDTKAAYDFHKITTTPKLQKFRKGFFKSTCFESLNEGEKTEEYCIFINPTINHGQGMVIVTPTQLFKEALNDELDLFGDPLKLESVSKVVEIPGKGRGLVASRDLQMGEYVGRERPVCLFPTSQPMWSTPLGVDICRQAIDHLPPQTRASIAALAGEGATADVFLWEVIKTNNFGHNIYRGDSTVYGALFLSASRFNHSCRPNVVDYLTPDTMTMHTKAAEPIAKGEELTLDYTSPEAYRKARQEKLKDSWNFICTCSHCQMSPELGEQSDQRITRIAELKQLYEIDPNFSTGDAEELLHLYKMEKLPWGILDSHLTAAKVYNSQLNSAKVIEHAEKYKSLGLMLIGTGWSGLAEANLLTQQAEKHPSHLTP